jgi:hypothetical protein
MRKRKREREREREREGEIAAHAFGISDEVEQYTENAQKNSREGEKFFIGKQR